MLPSRLNEILGQRQLSALFQPIINMQSGAVVDYEGLNREPSDSPLRSPLNLFKVARANKLTVEVEHILPPRGAGAFRRLKPAGQINNSRQVGC